MRVWIIQIGERHRETDGDVKLWRSVRLSKILHQRGHDVTFITPTFDHFAHIDTSIHKIHFLKYNEDEWNRIAGNKYM